jgi:hypothetical protein
MVLVGLGVLLLWGFAIWMWFDALTVPAARWKAAPTRETKGSWFAAWYVGGLLTFGLVPIAMAFYYHARIRPPLRAPNPETPVRASPDVWSVVRDAVPTSSAEDRLEHLERLQVLRVHGALTEDEFAREKQAVLAETQAGSPAVVTMENPVDATGGPAGATSSVGGPATTRALYVSCPRCGAQPGEPCHVDGSYSSSVHEERSYAAAPPSLRP